MTADQRSKLSELRDIFDHLEIYETGPSEDVNRGRLLISSLLSEADHNPFSEHWKEDATGSLHRTL